MKVKHKISTVAVINSIVLLIICIIQFFPVPLINIGFAVPVLAVGFVTAVAAFYGEAQGACWGFISGLFFDALSGTHICFSTITLTLIGLIAGLLMTHTLNLNRYSLALLSFCSAAVYFLADWLTHYAFTSGDAFRFLTAHAIPSVIYTALFGILFIFIYSKISKKTAIGRE